MVPRRVEVTEGPPTRKRQQYELAEVNTVYAGSYFGELALLNDAPRTATIICKEDCEFAVMEADDFKEILGGRNINVILLFK